MYRQDSDAFSMAYRRRTPGRLSAGVEAQIESALLREKALVDDAELPISSYNYTAMKDRLEASGIKVSLTTIINGAKKLGCHRPRRREKLTTGRW